MRREFYTINKIKIIIFTLFTLLLSSCTYYDDLIIIGKGSWESNDFYNEVVKIILEEGYDKRVEVVPVTTPVLVQGLKGGQIHLNIETWSENMPTYNSDIKNNYYEELSINFNDNEQGIFTTKYFAKYMANELKKDINDLYINDLIHFKQFLQNDDYSNKKIIYAGTTEWEVTEFLIKKFSNEIDYKDLVDNFVLDPIRSTPILNQLLISAHENYNRTKEITKDSVWVGYNWKPTAIMGKYDMVLLKDKRDDFNLEKGIGNIASSNVTIVSIPEFKNKHYDAYLFLKNFKTTSDVASKALAYMQDNENKSINDTALYWLENNIDYWQNFVSNEAFNKVLNYINKEGVNND